MPDGHAHRWLRWTDPDTGVTNHWCVDGDTEHHNEPCADAAAGTGDHEADATTVDDMPVHEDVQL
jgi:hypothetical protein